MIERLGAENVVSFGHTVEELTELRDYRPYEMLDKDPELKAVFSFLEEAIGQFPDGHSVYPLLASLQDSDPYYVMLDFADYIARQNMVDTLYADRPRWLTMSLMSIANSGWFSSDRAVREYARDIWGERN